MAWECACGISNHNEAFRCAGCGWSREQGKQDGIGGESQQQVDDINKGPYKKWGVGKSILFCATLEMVFQGIEKSDSPSVLIIFVSLGILLTIGFFRT